MKKLVSLSIAISDTAVSTALIVKEAAKKETLVDAKPVIETYRKKTFNPEYEDVTYAYLEERMGILLKNIIKETRFEDLIKADLHVGEVKKVVISIAAPWFEGRIVTSLFEQAKEFKVTEAVLNNAFNIEIRKISGTEKDPVKILETNVLSSTLNGYEIQEPVGKMARSLALSGYVSYTKASLYNLLIEIINSNFHDADQIIIKTEPTLLLSAAIREADMMDIKSDFAIIRVNEIITHIQVIRNNNIRDLGTIPIGLNTLLKEMSEKCLVTYEVALSLLNLYFERNIEQDSIDKIQPVIESVLSVWRQGIKDFSLGEVSSGTFPSKVFLSSPSVISHILYDYLTKDDYLNLTMSEKSLSIEILDRSTLNNFIEIRENIDGEPGFLTKLNAMI